MCSAYLKTYARGARPDFCQLYDIPLTVLSQHSVGGVTVSMDAFQAFDPGSTPGLRILLLHYLMIRI